MSFVKNRKEKDAFEIGFANRLASDETISTATVAVDWAALFQWQTVTTDVLLGSPTVSNDGKTVQFSLKAAATDDVQPSGQYRVLASVTTSKGRTLVGVAELRIEI